MKLFVDLDGVMVDFCSAACREVGLVHDEKSEEAKEYDIPKRANLNPEIFWARIRNKQPCWWYDLAEYRWTKELHKLFLGFDEYHVCSSPGYMANAAAGKVQWINARLGRPFVLCRDKWLLAKPGAVLIDDTPAQVDDFITHGGQAILFPQPWNDAWDTKFIDAPQLRVAHIKEQLKKLAEANAII
jgi:5'(3')-deoxyribonucleotidase